jgi:serine/threonine protein kinase
MVDLTHQHQKADEFLQRIKDRHEELYTQHRLPIELKGLLTIEELKAIYWEFIYSGNTLYSVYDLKNQFPYRIAKEDSGLARTVNLILHPVTKEMCLILETKRKTTAKKDRAMPVLSGSYKTTKPAWRIDSIQPEKYANSVYYATDHYGIEKAKKEVLFSQKVQTRGADIFTNLMIAGAAFNKAGVQKVQDQKKISLYSKWANLGDLALCLKSNPAFTKSQLDELTTQLLISVENLHEKGFIHQDIKLENVLIYKDDAGKYSLALTDFGEVDSAEFPKCRPKATYGYESPEISAAHYFWQKEPSFSYDYFHQQSTVSYGQEIFNLNQKFYKDQIDKQKSQFSRSHKSNDMWAIGIILEQLYQRSYYGQNWDFKHHPLISGLLNPDREKRLTASQALVLNYIKLSTKIPGLIRQEFQSGPWEGLNLLEYALVHRDENSIKSLLAKDPSLVNHMITKGQYKDCTPLLLSFSHSKPPIVKALLRHALKNNENYKESLEVGEYHCRINKIKNPVVRELIFSAVAMQKKRATGRINFLSCDDAEVLQYLRNLSLSKRRPF